MKNLSLLLAACALAAPASWASVPAFAALGPLSQTLTLHKNASSVWGYTVEQDKAGAHYTVLVTTPEAAAFVASMPEKQDLQCQVSALMQNISASNTHLVWTVFAVDAQTCVTK